MTLGIVQDRAREAELTHAQYKGNIYFDFARIAG